MLGSNGYKDLDREDDGNAGAASSSAAYGGAATSQNIDLTNLNLDVSAGAGDDRKDDNTFGAVDGDGSGGGGGSGNPVYDFDYTPTPFNPAKTNRCLVENVVMTIVLAINMILGIASVATVQLEYRDSNLRIRTTAGVVQGCLNTECGHYILPEVFCKSYLDNAAGYIACIVIAIVFSLVAFIFSICNLCGRVCVSKYLVVILAIITWIFFLVSVICLSTLRTSKLCNDVSLGELGFKYGPSFPLCLTLFILLSLNILFYFAMRIKRPVRYSY